MSEIINAFLHLRRAARLNDAVVNIIYRDMTAARRQAKKLELASPFNAARAALLRADADGMEPGYKRALELQRELGVVLINFAREFDAVTTLAGRCELLNVNVADRGDLTADCGLKHITNAYGLEDSAQRRRMPWKSPPPCTAPSTPRFCASCLPTKARPPCRSCGPPQ